MSKDIVERAGEAWVFSWFIDTSGVPHLEHVKMFLKLTVTKSPSFREGKDLLLTPSLTAVH